MKNIKIEKRPGIKLFLLPLLLLGMMVAFTSCEDEDPIKDPPMLSLATESAQNVAGAEVSTIVSINAPEGAKSLNILRNGSPHSTVSFNGETSMEYEFLYEVEPLDFGTTVTFSFQVSDMMDRTTNIKTFTITVIAKPIVEIPEGFLKGTINWTADKIYRLNGFVRVDDGAKLYIEPGTLVIGDRETKGTLIVQMGGQIFAEGTRENPIVMTSENPPGLREPGDWGGLVVCGRAPNNVTAVTGQPVELEGGYGGFHGGTNPDDNSGILRFVRIEYAGIPINPNEEVNTLTMGSVGRGTVIEYVMASYGLDDAFEWFGGTVDNKYLIAYRGLDDDWDVDLGFSGRMQFGLSIRGASLADQSGSNGFEVDNNGAGSNAQPYTSGVFANITNIGPKKTRETPISLQFQHAAQLRRNSRISIYNTIMTGYPDGLFIDDARGGSGQAALDGELQIRNVYLAGVEHWGGNGYGSAGDIFTGAPANGADHPNAPRGRALKSHENFPGGQQAYEEWFHRSEFNNQLIDSWTSLGIDDSFFDLGIPKVTLNSGSVLLDAAKWDNTPKADAWFEKVPYVGAFGTEDWTEGWAEWNAHLVRYF